MIESAEKSGLLKPGGTIIEASSGNQGISTAMIGSIKGYNVIITVFEKASDEKVSTIKAYGAQVIKCPLTKSLDDPLSYHSKALELHKKIENSYMVNQYKNPDNLKAHYYSLGPEIWQQTQGKITHFFAGIGSGGTICGAGKYLKERNPKIKVIAIDSANSYRSTNGAPKPYKLEGIGVDFKSPIIDYSIIDDIIEVHDDESFESLKYLAKNGLLVGPASGAVACAIKKYLNNLSENHIGIAIFGDSGRAYLTKNYYN